MNSRLTLVIPCYNEERRLDLGAFSRFLSTAPTVRVLFVDDGSTDGTAGMLQRYAATTSGQASFLRLPENRGKAEAVRAGMTKALDDGTALVGFWDADLATPLDAVFDLMGVLSRRPDIDWVLGARIQLLGRDIRRRAIRHYLGRVFATAASLVLAMPVYDTQCGAKLFRASAELRQVLSTPFVSRWVFDVEMLSRFAVILSATGDRSAVSRVFEQPLANWMDVAGSKVKGRDFFRASAELAHIWYIQRQSSKNRAKAAAHELKSESRVA